MFKYFNINSEGCSICCKLYQNEGQKADKVVLFGHGFGGHRDNRAAERFAKRILSKNKSAAVVTFDWPCHGSDVRKTLRLEDCASYLQQVCAYIGRTFAPEALLAYCTSFGGYLFLKYISENGSPFKRIALRCPAVNMYEIMTERILSEDDRTKLEKGKPVLAGFDRKIKVDKPFIDSLKEADIMQRDFLEFADDILIIQGTADEVVPPEAVSRFADDNCILYEAVEGADHRFQDPTKMDAAIAEITAFLGLK